MIRAVIFDTSARYTLTEMEAATDEQADRYLVPVQFFCFAASLVAGILTAVMPKDPVGPYQLAVQVAGSLFICGSVLLAVKFSREKLDMAAAGFGVIAISWGFISTSVDAEMSASGMHLFTTATYFMVPGMWLLLFHPRFPWWLKVAIFLSVIPFIVFSCEIERSDTKHMVDFDRWGYSGFAAIHWTSLAWSIVIMRNHRKDIEERRKHIL